MKPAPKHDRFVPPIMHAFRSAFRDRDSAKALDLRGEDGERILAGRRTTPRSTASEALLRQDLAEDLAALLNTVNLGSAVDLDGLDFVQRSILNYGIDDLTAVSAGAIANGQVSAKVRELLETYEPRLAEGSVNVTENRKFDELNVKLSLHVSADMYATPADVPIEFVADVAPFGNTVKLSKL